MLGILIGGCGRRAELEACNIAEHACQEDVYYAILRLRGDGFDPFDGVPPIRTITEQQYRAELTARLPGPAPTEPDEPPAPDPRDVALQWLGLIMPTTTRGQASVDDRTEIVAAYYESALQRVTVIDRGRERVELADTMLLAHELVHAFQDDEIDWSNDGTSDGGFAANARIEGEAKLYEHLALAEMDDSATQPADLPAQFAHNIEWYRSEKMPYTTRPYYAVSWFAYDLGVDRLIRGWLEGGNAAVRALTADPPQRSVDYLAFHAGKELGEMPSLRCAISPPDPDYETRIFDRLGALQLYGFLVAAGVAEPDAWSLAADWRDDQLWIFGDKDAPQVQLSWRIRLATESAAGVVAAAARSRAQLRAERHGSDALILGSEDASSDWSGGECATN